MTGLAFQKVGKHSPVKSIAVTKMLVATPKTAPESVLQVRTVAWRRHTNVGSMRVDAISSTNYLEERMGIRGASLELDGQSGEQQNLDGCTRSVPERARYTIAIRNARGLEQGGRPSPATYNSRGHQAALDGSTA